MAVEPIGKLGNAVKDALASVNGIVAPDSAEYALIGDAISLVEEPTNKELFLKVWTGLGELLVNEEEKTLPQQAVITAVFASVYRKLWQRSGAWKMCEITTAIVKKHKASQN